MGDYYTKNKLLTTDNSVNRKKCGCAECGGFVGWGIDCGIKSNEPIKKFYFKKIQNINLCDCRYCTNKCGCAECGGFVGWGIDCGGCQKNKVK